MTFQDLDLSNIAQLTKEEIIKRISDSMIIGPVLMVWLSTMLLFLLIGLVMVTENRDRLLYLWVIVFVLSALVVAAVLLMPNATQTAIANIANFFNI